MNASEAAVLPQRGIAARPPGAGELQPPHKPNRKRWVLIGVAVWLGVTILLVVLFGSHGRNHSYEPQAEFKLESWVDLGIFSINKAVLYLLIASSLTAGTMIWVAKRMQARPNRVQTAVETIYRLMRDNITGSAMDDRMARKWFPFVGTLFLFILFSNLIGYIPLPTNTLDEFTLFGVKVPSFSIYAATANISVPLVLALTVFISYTVEGVRAKGPIGYLKGLVPGGVKGLVAGIIFGLEVLSNLTRILSLTIRLWANILAGHLIILFMAGALAVLLGITALGWFTLPFAILIFGFEVGLVAALQAFIFATLTAIYLGGAVATEH
jgi:F-type H+-transporting ATPase subunit a